MDMYKFADRLVVLVDRLNALEKTRDLFAPYSRPRQIEEAIEKAVTEIQNFVGPISQEDMTDLAGFSVLGSAPPEAPRTNEYVFLIGALSEFESLEKLKTLYLECGLDDGYARGCNSYKFSLPEAPGFKDGMVSNFDAATMIGRGLAFSDGWRLDDSLSVLLKVSPDGTAP